MTKNKIKLFKILNTVLALGVCFSLTKNLNHVKAKIKSSTQEEKLNEEKEIEGFKLKQIVKKDNAKFLIYEHKLSGALAVIHNINYNDFNGVYFANLEKNSSAKTLALKQLFEDEISKKFKSFQNSIINYDKEFSPFNLKGQDFILTLDLTFKNKRLFNFILEELKKPSFFKDENITKDFKNKIKLQISEIIHNQKTFLNSYQNFEIYKILNNRFVGGKNLTETDFKEEIENLTIEDLKEEFKNKMLPQNAMVVINSLKHKNYKEILEDFSNNYFNHFKKTGEQSNFKHKVEKEAFRKFEVEPLEISAFGNRRDPHREKPKFMARLYYDVSNLQEDEKYYIALCCSNFENLVKNRLKELGYCDIVNYNEKEYFNGGYDTIFFDNLIFVDLFGNDEKLFEKETLIKNFKEIIKEFIKKAKNLNEIKTKNLSSLTLNDKSYFDYFENIENCDFLRKHMIEDYIVDSFNLTKNPFSPKYFKISQNGELKDIADKQSFYQNFKNFEKNLNFFSINKPKYIDILTVKNKNKHKEKEFEFKYYENPLKFPEEQNKKPYSKKEMVKNILTEIIYKNFFKKNLADKGLASNFSIYGLTLYFPENNKKEVEKYIFGEFKEKFKNFKPSEEDFNYFIKKNIKKLNLEIKEINKYIKTIQDFLNNEKKIKNLAEKNRSIVDSVIKRLEEDIEISEKRINSGEDIEVVENLKKNIAEFKKEIKELKENRNNLTFFEEKIKKRNKENIENNENFLKTKENFLEKIKTIKFEDVLSLFKKLEFKNISKLKKI